MRKSRCHPVIAKTDTAVSAETQYQYQNFQSRSRLDARLWLTCRLALVKSMIGEIQGLGQVKGKFIKHTTIKAME